MEKQTVNIENIRKTTELSLPVSGAQVVLYTSLLVGDLEGVNQEDPLSSGISVATKLIKDWNIVGANGEKLEITPDSIKLLPMEDMNALSAEIEKLGKRMKKGSEKS